MERRSVSIGHLRMAVLMAVFLGSIQIAQPSRQREIYIEIFEPENWATISAEGFELRFTLAWDPAVEDVTKLIVEVGAGAQRGGGGYNQDLSHLLEKYDPRGAEPVSVFLRTPLGQTVSAVSLALYNSEGLYLGARNAQFRVANVTLEDRSTAESCILSFPGSGNHLVRFMIEFLTRRPTRGCSDLRDVPLYLNEYNGAHPLWEVDPAARPATEKWHWIQSYTGVYEEPRNFSERCGAKLVLVLRDFFEAIPRWFNVWNEHEGPVSEDARRARLELDSKVFLDNVAAFVGFPPSAAVLLQYHDLQADPDSAAALLAGLFGVAEERLEGWRAGSGALVRACRGGKHGSWQGQRSARSEFRSSHLSTWTAPQVQQFHSIFHAALQAYPPAVQVLLRPSLLRFWRLRLQLQGAGADAGTFKVEA